MAELPLEVLYTIFSKLPIKSLMRFKCVSKHWSRVISGDPCFATMQMNNHNFEDTQLLFLLRHRGPRFIEPQIHDGSHVFKVDLNHLTDEFNPTARKYKLVGSCNGLLLFTNHTQRVVWCNPVTQEIATFLCQESPNFMQYLFDISPKLLQRLPAWLDWYGRHGIGFDCLSKQYKMVHILAEERRVGGRVCNINVAAKVANLEGIDLSWRETKNFPEHYLGERAIYAIGCLHWTTRPDRRVVVSFLLDEEEFISSSIPNDYSYVDLAEIGGYLGLFNLSRGKMNVWVKKEVRGEWIKEYDINFPKKNLELCYLTRVIGTWKNGEVLLLTNCESLFSYNKESDSLTPVEIPGIEFEFDEISRMRGPKIELGEIIPMRGTIASISKFVQTQSFAF